MTRPAVTDADSWMREQERTNLRERRATRTVRAEDILGPGVAPQAVEIPDWNGPETEFNGFYFSRPSALHTPDSSSWWMGQSIVQNDGRHGVQYVWDYRGESSPPQVFVRRFAAEAGGTRFFSTWQPISPDDVGTIWLNGQGPPAPDLGTTGYYYLDSLTGDWYEKTGPTTWVLRGGLQGPPGVPGDPGDPGPPGLTWQGEWFPTFTYDVNDAVTHQGGSYRRIVAGQTNTTPDDDPTNWEIIAAPGGAGLTWRGPWSSTVDYTINDAVTYGGSSYRRRADQPSQAELGATNVFTANPSLESAGTHVNNFTRIRTDLPPDTSWSEFGAQSGRIVVNATDTAAQYVYPQCTGAPGTGRFPVTPGDRVSCRVRVRALRDGRIRLAVTYYTGGTGTTGAPQATVDVDLLAGQETTVQMIDVVTPTGTGAPPDGALLLIYPEPYGVLGTAPLGDHALIDGVAIYNHGQTPSGWTSVPYTDTTIGASPNQDTINWELVAAQGAQGPQGSQGIQGPPGANGQTLYTWLKYADTPTTGMSDDPTGKTYMGLAHNKTSATESNSYADYSWSLIKGDQGVPGAPGSDGQPTYTWVKYADSSAGAGMSDSPTGKAYIGLAYNKTTATESTTPGDYAWSLILGPQGDPGPEGPQGPEGPPGLEWEGAWDPVNFYEVNDAVTYGGAAFRRRVAGTTPGNPASDFENWALLASAGDPGPAGLEWRGTWNAATAYGVNDAVTWEGSAFRRTVAGTTSGEPDADTANWEMLASKGDTGPEGPQGPEGPAGEDAVPDIPPAFSPTLKIAGTNAGLVVRADNVDVGTEIEYHITTNPPIDTDGNALPFTPTDATMIGEATRAMVVVVNELPDGTVMRPGVKYYMRAVALNEYAPTRDHTDAPPPSPMVTGQLDLSNIADVVAANLTAGFVLAGSIQVGQISIDANDGISIATEQGVIHFPADGSEATISGALRTNDAIIENNLTINGQSNALAGTLGLANVIAAPTSAPTVSWTRYTSASLPNDTYGLCDRVTDTGVFVTTHWASESVRHYDRFTGALLQTWDNLGGNNRWLPVSITRNDSYYFVACLEKTTNDAHVVRLNPDGSWAGSFFVETGANFKGWHGVGYDWVNDDLLVGLLRTQQDDIRIRAYDPTVMTGTHLYQRFMVQPVVDSPGYVHQVQRGPFGPAGEDRFFIVTADDIFVYPTGTGSAHETRTEWNYRGAYYSRVAPSSVTPDPIMFSLSDSNQLIWLNIHNYWQQSVSATYTWYDSDAAGTGTHETPPSPPKSYAPDLWSWVKVTTPPAPDKGNVDDPNTVRIYLDNKRQAEVAPTTGGITVIYAKVTGSVAAPVNNGFTSATTNPGVIRSDATDVSGPIIDLQGNGVARLGPLSLSAAGVLNVSGQTLDSKIDSRADARINVRFPADTWHKIGNAGEPGFQNGWQNYNTFNEVYFTKDISGVVHIVGRVFKPTSASGESFIFDLPVGYRPTQSPKDFLTPSSTGPMRGRVQTGGQVSIFDPFANGWVSVAMSVPAM